MAHPSASLVAATARGRAGVRPLVRQPVKLAGLGVYLPPSRVANADLETELGLKPGWIETLTGVRERRRASGDTSAGMAARAARMAMEHAAVGADEIDLVVGASVSRQQLIPCTAAFVQRELDLPEGKSFCFDVDATCLSFLVALHAAAPLVASGAYRAALIYSAELTSRMFDAKEPETSVLFGDGAAAAVLTASGPDEGCALEGAAFATYNSGAELTQCPGGGTLHHPNDPTTTPDMNRFHMQGRAVLKQAVRLMVPFLDEFLVRVGWERDTIHRVVPHQTSRMGLAQWVSRGGFRPEQMVINLPERGNCVAASMPLALAEAVHAGDIRRGQRVLLIGTGAGLSLGAAAVTF